MEQLEGTAGPWRKVGGCSGRLGRDTAPSRTASVLRCNARNKFAAIAKAAYRSCDPRRCELGQAGTSVSGGSADDAPSQGRGRDRRSAVHGTR